MGLLEGGMFIDKCLTIPFTFSALITTIADGAGTLLFYDPVTQPQQYESVDKAYRDACCIQGGDCDMFLSTHDINHGNGYQPPKECKHLSVQVSNLLWYYPCIA